MPRRIHFTRRALLKATLLTPTTYLKPLEDWLRHTEAGA
jgi:hypothetical protein